jgi:hypothetical protein
MQILFLNLKFIFFLTFNKKLTSIQHHHTHYIIPDLHILKAFLVAILFHLILINLFIY